MSAAAAASGGGSVPGVQRGLVWLRDARISASSVPPLGSVVLYLGAGKKCLRKRALLEL